MVGRVMVSITAQASHPLLIDIRGQRALRVGRLVVVAYDQEAKQKMASLLKPNYMRQILLFTLDDLMSRPPVLYMEDTYLIILRMTDQDQAKVREVLAEAPKTLGYHHLTYDINGP